MRNHDRQGPTGDARSGNPLEVQVIDSAVLVRNARQPDGPVLELDRNSWRQFLDAVRSGEFDIS
jgi:hypothetical protein